MDAMVFSSFCFFALFFFSTFLHRVVLSEASLHSAEERASYPPRGWNSYDSFCWTISEEEFLHNAELVSQRLHHHGYRYVVVDYLWYRRKVEGAHTDSYGFDVIDEWGRMVPDPERWPSSKGGKGFTEVANKVHSMGLKFGIHVMRGISTQAFNANTPILDTQKGVAYVESGRHWRAQDIGLKERACAWMPHGFMSVNTMLGAGKAFLRSLYTQYAEWGVDFVKHDCIFGDDFDVAEISIVSEVLRKLHHPILYSLSPGTSVTPSMAKNVSKLVNMYRVTGDDWDTWADVAAHFNVSREFSTANMIGSKGLLGKSWPDLDMLPLGWITDPGSNEGPHRSSRLSLAEQRTQMTLWSMAKSPLMFGGDMRNLDDTTYRLISDPTLLEINTFSSNNKEFLHIKEYTQSSDNRKQVRDLKSRSGTTQTGLLGLTNCNDSRAIGWDVMKGMEKDFLQFCWKDNKHDNKSHEPFCLFKRQLPFALDDGIVFEQHYQEKLHLFATDKSSFCLDASPRRRLTSKESTVGSFSPCKWNANQMWEYNFDGALRSNYSGLCTTPDTVEDDASSNGVRAWLATGRRGEIYLALFNLNAHATEVSAKIADLAKALPSKNLSHASCKCREVWSGKDYGIVEKSISMTLRVHDTALLVLRCT